jgi:hypothetical protein
MKISFIPTALLALALGGTAVHGDVLELKNGQVLNGKYTGGTAGTVRFETSGGLQVIETSQIVALTFTTPATTSATPAAAAPTAAPAGTPATPPAAAPKTVTLPAGTTLLVRMMDSISSKNPAGTKFTTKLEYDLAVGGAVAIKGGTVIYGKVQSSTQAKRARGKSTLDLRLAEAVVNGQPVPLVTSGFQEAGEASIKKAAKGAAVGAAIGAIADDEAGKGAAIGATASLLKKGETVTVPPGTLIEFTLTQPVSITGAQ